MFADLYPDDVTGMVLVDARHESLEPDFTPEENAKAQEAYRSSDDNTLRAAVLTDGLPLIVLVASTSIDADPNWLGAQETMAALSSNSQLMIVEGASHTIHWDQPAYVIDAARSVVAAARG
jgi:pimeloyl-ACP methyl ester carboxylesterase